MKTPCMIIVQYVLPAIRVLTARDMTSKHNMRKIDVAEKMKLTPAAITQYMKGTRGAVLVEPIAESEKTMKIISEIAEALASGNPSEEAITDKLCEACMTIRSEGSCGLRQ